MGKFARVALGTRHIDYNGRLCMVSAGTAYKGALGVDRAPNPWSDIPAAEVILAIGANIGECAPITTDYIWRARDKGARLIVADPRFTPIARNADLFLPVRPGTDLALLMGMLHVIVRDGLTDGEFIAAHTTGFEKTAESVEPWNPRRAAEVSGVAPEAIERAAHWIGESRRAMLMHARGLEHHSKGVENCEAVLAIALATGNMGREGAGAIMITGQGNGQGGREHGQKCDQLPGQRSLTDPAAREHVAGVWGISPEELPGPGYTAVEIMNAIHSGEIKGLLSICFNPLVSLPDANFTREALERLEFFGIIDFFLSETAAHADVVLAGSLQEEEEGVTANVEARVIHIRKAVDPPGNARTDSDIICDLARRLGRGQYFPFREPREIFEELRLASRGGIADYYGITYEKIDERKGVFWPCPTLDHPGTPRLFEDGRFFHPDGKAHFMSLAWRESGDPIDADFPVYLTTGRVVSQYLSGHPDAPHRGAGGSVPRAQDRDASEAGGTARNPERRLGDGDFPPRRHHAGGHGGPHHSARYRLHSLPLARRPQRQPPDSPHARSAQQDSRVQSFGLPDRESRGSGRAPGKCSAWNSTSTRRAASAASRA